MTPTQIRGCLTHLIAAEALMEQAEDFVSLSHLTFAIDMFCRAHGLPDRTPEELGLDLGRGRLAS